MPGDKISCRHAHGTALRATRLQGQLKKEKLNQDNMSGIIANYYNIIKNYQLQVTAE